ncbi:MAG: DUF3800 domain-containing protein [Clostridia bacterium]|nr:DUF3800 domain-containing protein [Clostridia bacterium]
MNLYIYSDESGVLDKLHNDYYIFGGLIFVSPQRREEYSRRFIAAERNIRLSEGFPDSAEVKASKLRAKSKNKLYRAVKDIERFGAVINQQNLVREELFESKKTKQRYLDWVYRQAVIEKLKIMIRKGIIYPDEVEAVYFNVDEHSTATDGLYELEEALERDLKLGMLEYSSMTFKEPMFKNAKTVDVRYCQSSSTTLVRAADIIANHLFYEANRQNGVIEYDEKLHVFYHPKPE